MINWRGGVLDLGMLLVPFRTFGEAAYFDLEAHALPLQDDVAARLRLRVCRQPPYPLMVATAIGPICKAEGGPRHLTSHAEQLFTRAGQFLCGDGPKWKEQFAAMLNIRTNSVDNMSKGDSRVPQSMWLEIAGFIQDREQHASSLKAAVLVAAEPAFAGQRDFQRAALNNVRPAEPHSAFAASQMAYRPDPAFDGQPDARRALLNNRQGDGFQRAVTSGPRPSMKRVRISPAIIGASFTAQAIAAINLQFQGAPAEHAFRQFELLAADNGGATLVVPVWVSEEDIERTKAWMQEEMKKWGFTIDPMRTTNASGSFEG